MIPAPSSLHAAARPEHSRARPLSGVVPGRLLWQTMARIAVKMIVHDRLRSGSTLFGVVFALVLVNQNVAMMSFLVRRNTTFVDAAGVDLWVVPAGAKRIDGGALLPMGTLLQARSTPKVVEAQPLVFGTASMRLPTGASEPISVIGTKLPQALGGPYDLVAGSAEAIALPDTLTFEDSQRDKLGGLDLGDSCEVNGQRVHVGAFTWGLVPFGPSFAFAEYDTARRLLAVPADRLNYVLVRLDAGADRDAVQRELARRVPEADVVTTAQLHDSTARFVLLDQGVGIMLGMSTAIALLVGFAIVSLTLFTSVLEKLREFGTLKAVGATTVDLARLLFVQAVIFASVGSLIGCAVVCQLAWVSRSAAMNMVLDGRVVAASVVVVFFLCLLASLGAIAKLHRLEPGMVFR